jgi:MipA family protein
MQHPNTLLRTGLRSAATLASAFALAAQANLVHAEEAPPAPAPPASGDDDKWQIALGAGAIVTPKYPGSKSLDVLPYPALDISYDDRFFSQGPDVLGVNALRRDDYHVGAALSFDFQQRRASDDARLKGLGDVKITPKLKLFADYTAWMFTGSVALYQDIGGQHQGKLVVTDLYATLPSGPLTVSAGPGFTWSDAEYARTFFGVSPAQSAASGMPVHDAGSGIRDVHLNGYVGYAFSKHWSGTVSATLARLQGSAARSPIAQRRTELTMLASVNYRF